MTVEEFPTKGSKFIVGVVGLDHRGIFLVQRIAMAGVVHFVLYDSDGSSASGARQAKVAELQANIVAETHACRWQDHPQPLRSCNLIFGSLSNSSERLELEAAARHHWVPYIDTNLDIHMQVGGPPLITGWVALSLPGHPCLQCMGLAHQANQLEQSHGSVAPEVHAHLRSAHDVLASLAASIGLEVISHPGKVTPRSLQYDWVLPDAHPHIRVAFLPPGKCRHYFL